MEEILRSTEPLEEGEKEIELTHVMNEFDEWDELTRKKQINQLFYIGNYGPTGDMFNVDGKVYKGHKNSGKWF